MLIEEKGRNLIEHLTWVRRLLILRLMGWLLDVCYEGGVHASFTDSSPHHLRSK